jgi:hypothetical protein
MAWNARRESLLLALLVCAAAAIRLVAAWGDLWLDEVWSLSFARDAARPWEILTSIHHDNNHALNTLALFVTVRTVGAHAPAIAYRVLPLLSGMSLVPLLFWTERRAGGPHATRGAAFAALLCAASFLAIMYSSEARGYAPAAWFAVAAFAIARQPVTSGRRRLAFAACCALGILSHLTFLFVYIALLVWTVGRDALRRCIDWRSWIALHRLPLVIMAGYYIVDVRNFAYGGGPPFDAAAVVRRALALSVGGPEEGALALAAALCAAAMIGWGIVLLARERRNEALFFAALFASPGAVLLVYTPRFLDVRYFFVLLPFFFVLASGTLARLWIERHARVCALAFLALFVAGNAEHLRPLLRDGRGHYTEAVNEMAALAAGRTTTVGGDNDFRNRLMLTYYSETLPAHGGLTYIPASDWTAERPDLMLTHTFGLADAQQPPVEIVGGNGRPYDLVCWFPYGGMSGWNWYVYQRRLPRVPRQSAALFELNWLRR